MRADSMFLYTIDKEAERQGGRAGAGRFRSPCRGTSACGGFDGAPPRSGGRAEVGAEAGADPGTEAGVSLPDGAADSLRPVASPAAGNAGERPGGRVEAVLPRAPAGLRSEGLDSGESASPVMPDSLAAAADSLRQPVVNPLDTLVGDARKAFLKEQARKEKEKGEEGQGRGAPKTPRRDCRKASGEAHGPAARAEGA